jgi:hypothetical protein
MAILSGFAVRGGAFIIGMALHVFLFRVGEWDLQTTRLIVTSVVAYIAAIVGTHRFLAQEYESLPYAIKDVSVIALCVTAGIFISLLTYRLLFHRLNKFPGPLVARLSNIYPTYLSTKKFHLYEEVQALHQQYGDYVRLGTSRKLLRTTHANKYRTIRTLHL